MTMAQERWESIHRIDTMLDTPQDDRETSLAAWTYTTRLDEDTVDDGSAPTVLRGID
ncbi:hypothetical protein [Actinophytocola sp.]|uniref:hypothetical protein n=1 Tax=Actinophytocola sp. TaxID=1872138 RepID=UPI002ED0E80B